MTDYLFLDYEQWGDLLKRLVIQLKVLAERSSIYKFTHIYGPPRGAWPIIAHLSHHFEDMQVIYDYEQFLDNDVGDNQNLLFIDDIIDTGKTAKSFLEHCEMIIEYHPTFQYKLCSVYYKPRSIVKPHLYYKEVDDETWVVFPWEDCKNCEYERVQFENRRKKELAIKTGKPVLMAGQISAADRLMWESFLNVSDEQE